MKRFGILAALLLILAAIVVAGNISPFCFRHMQWKSACAQDANAIAEMSMIATAIDIYQIDHDEYPESLDDLLSNSRPGSRPYLEHGDLTDPWGSPYSYVKTTPSAQNQFALTSLGPDKKLGTQDDIQQ